MSATEVPAVRLSVFDRRRAGVLLHATSLLSADGADSAFGARARRWIDWLAAAGFSVWQLLPLGPTGPDGSPYWVRSDRAGEPRLLGRACARTAGHGEGQSAARAVAEFRGRCADWLEDYALFVALAESQSGRPWWQWPAALRDRDPGMLALARAEHATRIDEVIEEQYRFEREWRAVREYANARGVRLFGDLPIYLAPDSVDVWAHREVFQLDATGRPLAVAGVPPDYFAATGQLWGNPLYDWGELERTDFAFWRARLRHQLARFDVLRIDHFRGLVAHWAVPAGAPDARGGSWHRSPGRALLEAVQQDFPDLPFIAEDLGEITPEVVRLRTEFGLAGMRVLQFGFDGDPDNVHLPHNYTRDSVAYPGTHDNDTSVGWYGSLDAATLKRVDDYLRVGRGEMPEPILRGVLGSVADLAVLPMQDLLGLDSAARLNTPGTVGHNWSWRLDEHALSEELARRFAHLNRLFGRVG
jgi:4-alpha-glucanotransferase